MRLYLGLSVVQHIVYRLITWLATLNIHSSMTATDVDEADQRLAELIVDILLTRATLDGNESEKEVSQQTEDEILSGQGAKGFSILTLSVGK